MMVCFYLFIITSTDKAEVMLLFCLSFCNAVNRITDERGNGRRPNLAGKRWPSRSFNFRWWSGSACGSLFHLFTIAE